MNRTLLYCLIAFGIFLFIAAIICFIFRKKDPYRKRESVLSDPENYFYHLLFDILPKEYLLVPQPPVIGCFSSSDITATNRILSKRFDYLIAKSESIADFPYRKLITVAVIELDDRSHAQPRRRERDEFINKLCKTHHLALLRFPCKSNRSLDYDREAIRSTVLRVLKEYEQRSFNRLCG